MSEPCPICDREGCPGADMLRAPDHTKVRSRRTKDGPQNVVAHMGGDIVGCPACDIMRDCAEHRVNWRDEALRLRAVVAIATIWQIAEDRLKVDNCEEYRADADDAREVLLTAARTLEVVRKEGTVKP